MFDPFSVPTLDKIVGELESKEGNDVSDTSLLPYLKYFKKFLNGMDVETKDINRQRRDDHDKKLVF
jgi:hypothetical protein